MTSSPINPTGLCQCGCGGTTTVSKRDDARLGVKTRDHFRFIRGHQHAKDRRFVRSDGYVAVFCPGHPRATRKYAHEHVLVAEKALGRYLPTGAVVHHVNEVKTDNTPGNLVILQSQSEHMELHSRQRVVRAGGNPWTQRICGTCGPKDASEFYRPKARAFSSQCRVCSSRSALERQRRARVCR